MKSDALDVVNAAALTNRGSVRERNEDTVAIGHTILTGDMCVPKEFCITEYPFLAMIADGMGGHSKGDLASLSAIKSLLESSFTNNVLTWRNALTLANDRMYDLMRERPEVLGLGSTVVGVALFAESLLCFNVGDSKAYYYGKDSFEQVSHDDVTAAGITNSKIRSHQLTQAIGGRLVRSRIHPHITARLPPRAGEGILLCSDGLTDLVAGAAISEALRKYEDPVRAAERLFELAIEAGGYDNVSIVVARVN